MREQCLEKRSLKKKRKNLKVNIQRISFNCVTRCTQFFSICNNDPFIPSPASECCMVKRLIEKHRCIGGHCDLSVHSKRKIRLYRHFEICRRFLTGIPFLSLIHYPSTHHIAGVYIETANILTISLQNEIVISIHSPVHKKLDKIE